VNLELFWYNLHVIRFKCYDFRVFRFKVLKLRV